MRIFFDTNVLVSALISRGLCADVFRISMMEFEVVLGEIVIQELELILTKKIKMAEMDVRKIILFLKNFEITPIPEYPYEIQMSDPDDKWILASAISAKAKILVSGDQDLLKLPRILKIRILSPRGFFEEYCKKKIK